MISFNSIGSHGRLGNQLHQYALLKAVSEKTGFQICLPTDLNQRQHHGQKCLLSNFKLDSALYVDINPTYNFVEEGYRFYDERVFKVGPGTNFSGHFEHQKYASDIREILINEFSLKDSIHYKCRQKYESFLSINGISNKVVSLHIRRGDLTEAPPEDNGWAFSMAEGTPYGDYYKSALSKLPNDCSVLVFSGGARLFGDGLAKRNKEDLDWCRRNMIRDERLIYVDDFDDMETLYVMNNADINITSYGSTFSWWGSFLNKTSIVFAPKKFFPTEKFNIYNENQFYPSFWKLL